MPGLIRRATTFVVLFALAVVTTPGFATPSMARLEGLVLGTSGEPAAGYRVVLIEPSGREVDQAITDARGLYSFPAVGAGTYAMGLRTPDGEQAPIFADPVQLAPGNLVRRDVALRPVPGAVADRAAVDYGLGEWWVSRTKSEKTFVLVGFIGGLALIYFLMRSDDDEQQQASPSSP